MKRFAIVWLLLILGTPACALATNAPVSSTALIEDTAALDGQTISYSGEVIGDVLPRGDHTWLNVSDGANAIGIWVETAALGSMPTPGRYGQTGDTVLVTGVFHRACPEHGGDLDLHAQQIEVVNQGTAKPKPVSGLRLTAALALSCADIGLLVWFLAGKRKFLR